MKFNVTREEAWLNDVLLTELENERRMLDHVLPMVGLTREELAQRLTMVRPPLGPHELGDKMRSAENRDWRRVWSETEEGRQALVESAKMMRGKKLA